MLHTNKPKKYKINQNIKMLAQLVYIGECAYNYIKWGMHALLGGYVVHYTVTNIILTCIFVTTWKGGLSYSEMLSGLLYKGERVVQHNQFQFLQYNNIVLCDESNNHISQKPGGICLLTDKRILLMSSQMNQCKSNQITFLSICLMVINYKPVIMSLS